MKLEIRAPDGKIVEVNAPDGSDPAAVARQVGERLGWNKPPEKNEVGNTALLMASGLGRGIDRGLNPLGILSGAATLADIAEPIINPGMFGKRIADRIIGRPAEPNRMAEIADFAQRNEAVTSPIGNAARLIGDPKIADAIQPEKLAKKLDVPITRIRRALIGGAEVAGNILPTAAIGSPGAALSTTAKAGVGAAIGDYVGGDTGRMIGAMAGPLVFNMPRARPAAPPSTASIDDEAAQAFEAFRKADAGVTRASYKDFARKIETKLKAEPVIDRDLQPKTLAIFRKIDERIADPSVQGVAMGDLWAIRRTINNVIARAEPDDARLLRSIKKDLDGYVRGLTRSDAAYGDVVEASRTLQRGISKYAQASTARELEGMIEAARQRSNQYVGPNFDKALRTEFAKITRDPSEMRRFSADVQAAMKAVVDGSPVRNILKFVGKFSPQGVIPALGHGALTATNPAAGIPALLGTTAARFGANRMAAGAAERAVETVRRGAALPKRPYKFSPELLRVLATYR